MAGAAFGGFATLGSQERRRTEIRRFLVINALRLGFWTHPGVYVKLFAEQVSASHMFCLRGNHAWPMDAVWEWMESNLDVIMLGPWMLCGNGWSLIWTLSWLAHGCSAALAMGMV